MKILITGANGQVGYSLEKLLAESSLQYLALTRDQLDITNAQAVNEQVSKYEPGVIINAAAYTAVDKAESSLDDAYRINRDGARNLAVAANLVGSAIFHISTDYVFAGDSETAYREDDLTAPQGVYGKSKLDGEIAVREANDKHIILRTAWVFGEHGNNFVKTMLRVGKDRDSLGVVADQFGGPTYAGDIASALVNIARQYKINGSIDWGTYHYSGMPHTTWFEFAQQIFNAADQAGIYSKPQPTLNAIATSDYPTPAKRPANSRLNCEKITKTFGVTASDWRHALNNIRNYAG